MHVLRQEETLCQAPGNSPTFTLRPGFDTSYHRKRLIFELEGGLPAHFWPRGGCHIRPNLGSWPSVTSRLSDCNPARYPGRWGSRGSITLDPGWLFGSALPFSGTTRIGGGEVGLFPWGCCYCAAGRALSRKRSMVIIRLTTISSSP